MASIRSKNSKLQARIKRGAILVEKSFLNKRDAERWARLAETEIERGVCPPSPGSKGGRPRQLAIARKRSGAPPAASQPRRLICVQPRWAAT